MPRNSRSYLATMIAAIWLSLAAARGICAAEQKPSGAIGGAELYVSTDGDDSWSGRLATANLNGGDIGPRYWIENTIDALDAPGEWFIAPRMALITINTARRMWSATTSSRWERVRN